MHAHLLACARLSVSTLMQFRRSRLGYGAAHNGLCLPTSISLGKFSQTHPLANEVHNPSLRFSFYVILLC